MVMPHALLTFSMISGLSGSPALTISRSFTGYEARFSSTQMRHTVGGAHSVVTPHRAICSRVARASNRSYWCTNIVAPAFQGAKKLLHACLAQPGELMFR